MQEVGFKKYGTIHWIPNVNTDSDGKFTFSIPNLYQQKVTIILEGISSTGEIISETSVIDIP